MQIVKLIRVSIHEMNKLLFAQVMFGINLIELLDSLSKNLLILDSLVAFVNLICLE